MVSSSVWAAGAFCRVVVDTVGAMTQRHSPAVPVGSDLSRLASLGERLRQAAQDLTALVCGDGPAGAR
jgi:hypothetical protein